MKDVYMVEFVGSTYLSLARNEEDAIELVLLETRSGNGREEESMTNFMGIHKVENFFESFKEDEDYIPVQKASEERPEGSLLIGYF